MSKKVEKVLDRFMSLNPLIFFDLVITIFILALTIIIIIVYFLRSIKKFHLYQIENQNLKDGVAKKNSSTLDEARNRAVKIIDEANNKALDIIQRANLFTNISDDALKRELRNVTQLELKSFEKATSDFIKVYEAVLNELRLKNVEIFQNVSKNIEINTLEEIKKFKNVIEQETISSEKLVKKKIDHEYSLAKKDIDTYRQNQLNMMDDKIYEILENVSKLVLGKTINLSEHEMLIIDSLEKAKNEAIFDNEK